ncbi:hypothetical protein NNC19_10875 [Clostridium sp. SHJSY1]|uniref:hypothetical protein n=1 Tax=Clostridium sp. SHJSY1 TaxID=2942483 RepID=UPI0028746C9A|nr:hypothetical protein [Clostridium sp. SHJSY1]MDS0526184.1 hypothetical protein [Clostridium sp. SHJSY1]
MKKQYICDFCGKTFNHNQREFCLKHEIKHLCLEKDFRSNLEKSIQILDEIYNCTCEIIGLEVRVYIDYYGAVQMEFKYSIYNSTIKKKIENVQIVKCEEKYIVPTIKEIVEFLNLEYYIPQMKLRYEGEFFLDTHSGSYYIGGIDMDIIYRAFKDKKVKIEIIETTIKGENSNGK